MSFDYFYGQQSDLFTFYRVPKVLFTNERFWNISTDAKMLYGILLDRMSLSAKNGWIDKNGRVYIIFTIDEAKMALNCAEQKAIKLLSELEKKAGLLERKRQGLGKPNLIYVKNFISAVDSQLLNCENHNFGTLEITTQELPKSQCNNTDIKNTEFSDTDSIFPSARFDALSDSIKAAEKRMVEVQALQQHIKNYRNTRQIYIEYRKSGYSKKFFEEHRQEITIHKAAKQAFDELQITKLPSMQSLYEEFHQLAVQKKQDYAEYRQIRKEKEELLIAKRTVETILNIVSAQ